MGVSHKIVLKFICDYVKALRERKYSRFIDGLIGDARYFELLLAHVLHMF